MSAIKCIIFDVGGVLTSDKIEPVFEHANRILGKKAFVKRKAVHNAALTGKISLQEHYKILSNKTGVPAKQLRDAFLQSCIKIMKPNRGAIEIAKRLKKKGYMVSIISNITEMAKKINTERNLFNGFYPMIFSCDVGYMKPQKRIFDIFLERTKISPHECIFIDDRKEHFHYPMRMGIKVVHFRNTKQLARDLKKLGVKI